ncbi:MAG: helix-turn-helix domain-containing protein [Anaerolineales bacterium]
MDSAISKTPNLERLLRATEVAEILNVSKAFVYQLMQKGLIRTVRIGASRRIRMEDLSRFIQENTAS